MATLDTDLVSLLGKKVYAKTFSSIEYDHDGESVKGTLSRQWIPTLEYYQYLIGSTIVDPETIESLTHNVFCATGKGGGQDNSCGKEGGPTSAQRDILDKAASIEFSDVPHPDIEGVGHFDLDGIEARMTNDEKEDMQIALDEMRDDNIRDLMHSYEPEISESDVRREAGCTGSDNQEQVRDILNAYKDEFTAEHDFDEAIERLYNTNIPTTKLQGERGIDNIIDMISDVIPESATLALIDYQKEIQGNIEKARTKLEDQAYKDEQEHLEESYDGGEDKQAYLQDFRREHLERYEASTQPIKDNVWAKDSDGDMAYYFTISNGTRYAVNMIETNLSEDIKVHDLSFANEAHPEMPYSITGSGHAFEVFGNVIPAVIAYMKHEDPPIVTFSAFEKSRQRLYDRMAKTVAKTNPGYMVAKKPVDTGTGKTIQQYAVIKKGTEAEAKFRSSSLTEGSHILVNQSYDIDAWWYRRSAWVHNAFCPTGDGGGQDNSCSSQHGSTLLASLKEHGGFTYQPLDDTSPKNGFAVAAFPGAEKILDADKITPSDIFDYLTTHADKFTDHRVHVGGWTDQGKVYLDLSMVVQNKDEAIKLGVKHNQLAVFDLGKMETITVPSQRTQERVHNAREAKTRTHTPKGLFSSGENDNGSEHVPQTHRTRTY